MRLREWARGKLDGENEEPLQEGGGYEGVYYWRWESQGRRGSSAGKEKKDEEGVIVMTGKE